MANLIPHEIRQKVLAYLQKQPLEPANIIEVGQALAISKTVATTAAEELEKQGLVKVTRITSKVLVKLTEKGMPNETALPQPKPETVKPPALKGVNPQPKAVKPKRNKPFTPNPTKGYQVANGKVKIFLDRKASSRTLTLTLEDLKELIRAAEKAQAV